MMNVLRGIEARWISPGRLLVGGWFVAGICAVAAAQGVPPGETLLPATTAACLLIPDLDRLEAQWDRTQVGRLMNDPVMKPFSDDFRRQMEGQLADVRQRFGISFEDIRTIRGGELSLAMVQPAPGAGARVVLIDVTGHGPEAVTLLDRVAKHQLNRGARQSRRDLGAVALMVFDLPADPAQRTGPQTVAYCLAGNLLAASDDVGTLTAVVGHLGQPGALDRLADQPGFQAVMRRLAADPGLSGAPQLRWFVHPLRYAEVNEALTPPEKRRKGKSLAVLMRNQGVAAIRGVGGVADFAAEGFELVHRTAIDAPPPYENAMQMAVFPVGTDFTPQPWVPRDVAMYATAYVDTEAAFDHFGPLFDELFGQGETGIWQQVLESMKLDPNGPRIDLRGDLVVYLGRRVSMFADYQLPITPTSERLLFAIECRDPAAVAAAVERLMSTDRTAHRRQIEGHVIWEMVEEPAAAPKGRPRNVPSFRPGASGGRPSPQAAKEEDEEEVRLLPHAAVTVEHGHLLVASHLDYLLKILKPLPPRERLAADVDYRMVAAALDQLGVERQCGRLFSRTEENYHPSYEMIRQNKMPQSEMALGRLVNRMFGAKEKAPPRESKIDGSKLPDYDVVRRYLGPAGMVFASEDGGWFIKGVTLTK